MKDIDTMLMRERFCYDTINIDYLRTRMPLPEWMKKQKTTRAEMTQYSMRYSHKDGPPGYPSHFILCPQNNGHRDVKDTFVMADPDNLAWNSIEYTKENRYQPTENTHHPAHMQSQYWIVLPSDYKHLFQPLPWNHLRMQLWEADMYYWHSAYLGHDEKPFYAGINQLDLIGIYPAKIDPHWTEEYKYEVQHAHERDMAAAVSEIDQYAKRWARPERHQAVQHIRKYFKDYQPNEALMKDPTSSPAWQWIDPYRWYYLYGSRADQDQDPIFELQNKKY